MLIQYVTDSEVDGGFAYHTRTLTVAPEFVRANPDEWYCQLERSIRAFLPKMVFVPPNDGSNTCTLRRGDGTSTQDWDKVKAETLNAYCQSLPPTAFVAVKASLTMAFMLEVALSHDVYGTGVAGIEGVLDAHYDAGNELSSHYSSGRIMTLYAPRLQPHDERLRQGLEAAFRFAHMP